MDAMDEEALPDHRGTSVIVEEVPELPESTDETVASSFVKYFYTTLQHIQKCLRETDSVR